jgi:hypothetical protein
MSIAFAELEGWLPRLESSRGDLEMIAEADVGRVRIPIPHDIQQRLNADEGRVVFKVVASFEPKR